MSLVILPLLLFFLSICLGRYPINPFRPLNYNEYVIIFLIRLPRVIIAMSVGAALSVSGATLQGTARNPLVGPEILGVSSGAAFGAALAIVFLESNPVFVQVSAFLFGLVAVFLAYSISKSLKGYGSSILTLILAGIAISAMFSALVGILKYMADPYEKLPAIVFWLLGSFAASDWQDVINVMPMLLIGIVIMLLLRWRINIISLGEEEAKSLGLNYERTRVVLIAATSLSTAASVAISGIISWIGLIVPHMARKLVGPDHKILIPASLSVGAIFMVLCDNLARTLTPFEIPISIVTSLIGAPVFLLLLKREGKQRW
jgi:iron complex transport system permease protein